MLKIGGGNPASTGNGQKMGETVGAEVVNGDLAQGPEIRFPAPPSPSVVARMPTNRVAASALLAAMKVLPPAVLRPNLLRFVTTFLALAAAVRGGRDPRQPARGTLLRRAELHPLLMPDGLDAFFARIGRPKAPGQPATEPFPRPDDIAQIERETVFGWADSSFDQKK